MTVFIYVAHCNRYEILFLDEPWSKNHTTTVLNMQSVGIYGKENCFLSKIFCRSCLRKERWHIRVFSMCFFVICGRLVTGNILNFNVGASVDLDVPRSFWSRLAGKYGNIFYWKEKVQLFLLISASRFYTRKVFPFL
eukprot:TRINITY_DN1472_c0_g2_i1.p2 TRINITY_DN1472_c0_g2~~TRINITY_DN1472_c0_g2_i1.p2  ORF type:complete len:137 (+),score=8.98 TRINITY_DN1472_c0_g2_i1:2267-2677(+)